MAEHWSLMSKALDLSPRTENKIQNLKTARWHHAYCPTLGRRGWKDQELEVGLGYLKKQTKVGLG